MKKAIVFLLMISVTAILPSAVQQTYRSLDVAATHGSYHRLVIRLFDSSDIILEGGIGMPFDLGGADVAYVSTTGNSAHTAGREIAEWAMHSNHTPVKITIDAEDLKLDTTTGSATADASRPNTDGLKYYLFFPYKFTGNDGKDVTGFMQVESGVTYNSEGNPISDNYDNGINTTYLPIRFMLHESVVISTYATGTYRANVKITLDGAE